MRLNPVSADSRRQLYEFGVGGNWKVAKYLIITSDCEIGGHLHRNKDELFLILRGSAEVNLDGQVSFAGPGEIIEVPRNTFHSFKCIDRTEILCLASELHNPNDDIT